MFKNSLTIPLIFLSSSMHGHTGNVFSFLNWDQWWSVMSLVLESILSNQFKNWSVYTVQLYDKLTFRWVKRCNNLNTVLKLFNKRFYYLWLKEQQNVKCSPLFFRLLSTFLIHPAFLTSLEPSLFPLASSSGASCIKLLTTI